MLNNAYFCSMTIPEKLKSLASNPATGQLNVIDGLKHFTTRRLTLKECLPELPPKTFYTWVEEGLIPNHFGQNSLRELLNQESSESYKGWNRFTIYEFFWIRLVYHLRQAGYPKQDIKRNAELFFPDKNPKLIGKIFEKFIQGEGDFQKLIQDRAKTIGEKSAQHEVEKLLQFLIESTTFSQFHFEVIEALLNCSLPYFIATGGGQISTQLPEQLANPSITNYGTFVAIPYLTIVNDLVLKADSEYIQNIFGVGNNAGIIIDQWKSVVRPQQPPPPSHSLSENKWLNGIAAMEAVLGFFNRMVSIKGQYKNG